MFAKPNCSTKNFPSPSNLLKVSLLAASFVVESANAQSEPDIGKASEPPAQQQASQVAGDRIEKLKQLRQSLGLLETNLNVILKLEKVSPGAITNNAKILELRTALEEYSQNLLKADREDHTDSKNNGGKSIQTTGLVIALTELNGMLHPNSLGSNWSTNAKAKTTSIGVEQLNATLTETRKLSGACFDEIAKTMVRKTIEASPANNAQDKK